MKVLKKYLNTLFAFVLTLLMFFSFTGCGQTVAPKLKEPQKVDISKLQLKVPMTKKDGMVYYEIFVRSFYDSNGDGIGDLKGVTEKLDYIKELGVNGIWLNPIYPSPSYHGYDVTDYKGINRDFGTMADFEELVSEAHKRGIKIILDYVPNHTSSKHPWFMDAVKSEKSQYRDYYVWADKDTNLKEPSDINPKAWYTKGKGYYYANFWSEMPDLNYDNEKVRNEIKDSAKFWLEKGVDGFRIDAARHIFPGKRKMDTLTWWQEFGDFVRGINKDAYLIGEVWSDELTIAPYFKVLDSNFNFELGDEIIKAVRGGNAGQLRRVMQASYDKYASVNKDFVDAPFLTNHDMDRAMSKLNNIDKMKSAAAIYMTLPGNPFIYYGEEIGMLGAKPDELIREPFLWYEKGGQGQTKWENSKYSKPGSVASEEKQDKNVGSLLNFYRDIIKFRLSNETLSKGDIRILDTDNSFLAFLRSYNGQSNLVVHNVKNQELSLELPLPEGVNIKGELIKGKGKIVIDGNKLKITLKPYSFAIVK